jgi:hypothetical protein
MFFPAGRRAGFNTAAYGAQRMISLIAGPQFGQMTNTAAAVTINFSPPPGSGDVVYVWQARSDNVPALATGGYTQIASEGFTNPILVYVWRKVMGASPDASVTSVVNTFGRSIVMGTIILRGVDSIMPEDVVPTTAMTDDVPPITTVTANTWILALYGVVNAGPVNIISPPAGYVNFATLSGAVTSVGSRAFALAGSTKLLPAVATEDPGSYGDTGKIGSVSFTIAVRRA